MFNPSWFRIGPMSYIDRSKAFRDTTPEGVVQAVTLIDVGEDTVALLVLETDVSPFEGLNSFGASGSSFTIFLSHFGPTRGGDYDVKSQTWSSLYKAFQCLGIFNLDLRGVYDQVFDSLCLRRKFYPWRAP